MTLEPAISEDRFGRPVQAVEHCDLCGCEDTRIVTDDGPSRCRIVMCENCGLLFASPSFAISALEGFYEDGFVGDPGTNRRLAGDSIDPRKIREEKRIAWSYSLPVIRRHLDVMGKSILDIRCRSGALADMLAREGAEVTAIDPMEQNAKHAHDRGTLVEARFVPVLELSELRGFEGNSFDAVTALTIHTLGHLPSPRRFLARLFDLLKPGGYLFMDEKDVLHPVRATGPSVFDSGAPHYFHFTEDTLRKYFVAAGFEVLECHIDPARKKALRHVPVVARKPSKPVAARPGTGDLAGDTAKVLRDLAKAEHRLQQRQGLNRLTRRTRNWLRTFVN